jgi:site-specific DNA recombinase
VCPTPQLKNQLDDCNVGLVDIYVVISSRQVNTLGHLGFEYKWSLYSPSKKSEILEAERAKDEMRDIMSRMIGAEIRYTQMGYWMRQPPFGFVSEKIETRNGKRCVLIPHPLEAEFVIKMFELRAQGIMLDNEIVDEINKIGYKSRVRYIRDSEDHTKIVAKHGVAPLTVKVMQKLMSHPIYAGVNNEKWTNGKPIRCVFDGLVSIELFNTANKGKVGITEDSDGKITIYKERAPEHFINKSMRNPEFAYRKFVLCPDCKRPLLGSASRGKAGKYYPAYHCSNYGHYFRIPKEQFEDTVRGFVKNLIFTQEAIDNVLAVVETEWHKRESIKQSVVIRLEDRIKQLAIEAELTKEKIKLVSSEAAIKYLDGDLEKIDKQIKELRMEKIKKNSSKKTDIQAVLQRVRKLMEYPEQLLLKQIDPVRKAQYFGAIFDKAPTYKDLKPGTQKTPLFSGVSQIFALAKMDKSLMVIPRGIEPLLSG